MGRKPIGFFPMTNGQRQRRYRRMEGERQTRRNIEYHLTSDALIQANCEIESLQCQIHSDGDTRYIELKKHIDALKATNAELLELNVEIRKETRETNIENGRLLGELHNARKRISELEAREPRSISTKDRVRLSKLLGQLGSDNEYIRDIAAKKLEGFRQYLNKSWCDILKCI